MTPLGISNEAKSAMAGLVNALHDATLVAGAPESRPTEARCAVAGGSLPGQSAEVNQLRSLLDDANGKLHILQSMMAEAGFPMRIKLGEDLYGNEDWVRVRPECQLRDVLRRLSEPSNKRQPEENIEVTQMRSP